MESDPGSSGSGDFTAQKVFGVGNILVERNMIELATGASTAEIAIHIDDSKTDTDTN